MFRQGIIDAVRTLLGASGQNLSADDVIFIAPCPCERSASSRRRAFDGALEVPIFIQSSEPDSAVSADAVVSAVNESGADIAQEVSTENGVHYWYVSVSCELYKHPRAFIQDTTVL